MKQSKIQKLGRLSWKFGRLASRIISLLICLSILMFWTPALAAPQAYPTTTSNQIFIPGSPTPPTLEELKAMENAPIGEPLVGTFMSHWISPNPRFNEKLKNVNVMWWFAGIESNYLYKGVQAILFTQQSGVPIHSRDFIAGWIGLDTPSGNDFVQTGWTYLPAGNPNGLPAGIDPFKNGSMDIIISPGYTKIIDYLQLPITLLGYALAVVTAGYVSYIGEVNGDHLPHAFIMRDAQHFMPQPMVKLAMMLASIIMECSP